MTVYQVVEKINALQNGDIKLAFTLLVTENVKKPGAD